MPKTATAAPTAASARERLLQAAGELFYAEGVHVVGIDRIIDRAGVAKASLYNTFGSKDELVRAYLGQRHARTQARITRAMERYDAPRDKLLGVFEALNDNFGDPDFRGCAFANASAEAQPGSVVEQATDEFRTWMRTLLTELSREAGARDPDSLGRQLQLLYDGAALTARMDRSPEAGRVSHAAAEAVVAAALAPITA